MVVRDIILIGLPGVGKTTVGRELSELTGSFFIDTDDLIVKKDGRSVPDIFAESGEDFFRELETSALIDIRDSKGKTNMGSWVIALGGGTVERSENLEILEDISPRPVFVWLRRSLESIEKTADIGGRPVSRTTPLDTIWKKRKPMYETWADVSFLIDGLTPLGVANKIISYSNLYSSL